MAEIVLSNVTKRWGQFYAVDNLSMVIENNAFVTLLGPSGCGKTTTLRMIAGLETPTSGRITIDGVPVFDSEAGINIPANRRKVGFLFQNYALWPNMTVYQNIAFGLSNVKEEMPAQHAPQGSGQTVIRKYTKKEIDDIVQRVSKVVKIGMFLDRYPNELSGGQQQRVAIARTLAPNPRVLFMDEPLSNLDAKLRLEMRSELQRLHLETGSTFIYVTHDQLEAMTLASKICLMDNGVLQQYEQPLTVYNRPANLFVADFVGNPAVNFIKAQGKQVAGGNFEMTLFDGLKASFVPKAPLNLNDFLTSAQAHYEQIELEEQEKTVPKANRNEVFLPPISIVEDPDGDTPPPMGGDFVLGVRPEFILIDEDGELEGEVFSAMPTGMETTVRIRLGRFLLTGVIFGGVLFTIGQKVRFRFQENAVQLFHAGYGQLMGLGSLHITQ